MNDRQMNRRSSILKPPKTRISQEEFDNEEEEKDFMFERRASRRVSFAEICQVKEFCEVSRHSTPPDAALDAENIAPSCEDWRGTKESSPDVASLQALLTGPIRFFQMPNNSPTDFPAIEFDQVGQLPAEEKICREPLKSLEPPFNNVEINSPPILPEMEHDHPNYEMSAMDMTFMYSEVDGSQPSISSLDENDYSIRESLVTELYDNCNMDLDSEEESCLKRNYLAELNSVLDCPLVTENALVKSNVGDALKDQSVYHRADDSPKSMNILAGGSGDITFKRLLSPSLGAGTSQKPQSCLPLPTKLDPSATMLQPVDMSINSSMGASSDGFSFMAKDNDSVAVGSSESCAQEIILNEGRKLSRTHYTMVSMNLSSSNISSGAEHRIIQENNHPPSLFSNLFPTASDEREDQNQIITDTESCAQEIISHEGPKLSRTHYTMVSMNLSSSNISSGAEHRIIQENNHPPCLFSNLFQTASDEREDQNQIITDTHNVAHVSICSNKVNEDIFTTVTERKVDVATDGLTDEADFRQRMMDQEPISVAKTNLALGRKQDKLIEESEIPPLDLNVVVCQTNENGTIAPAILLNDEERESPIDLPKIQPQQFQQNIKAVFRQSKSADRLTREPILARHTTQDTWTGRRAVSATHLPPRTRQVSGDLKPFSLLQMLMKKTEVPSFPKVGKAEVPEGIRDEERAPGGMLDEEKAPDGMLNEEMAIDRIIDEEKAPGGMQDQEKAPDGMLNEEMALDRIIDEEKTPVCNPELFDEKSLESGCTVSSTVCQEANALLPRGGPPVAYVDQPQLRTNPFRMLTTTPRPQQRHTLSTVEVPPSSISQPRVTKKVDLEIDNRPTAMIPFQVQRELNLNKTFEAAIVQELPQLESKSPPLATEDYDCLFATKLPYIIYETHSNVNLSGTSLVVEKEAPAALPLQSLTIEKQQFCRKEIGDVEMANLEYKTTLNQNTKMTENRVSQNDSKAHVIAHQDAKLFKKSKVAQARTTKSGSCFVSKLASDGAFETIAQSSVEVEKDCLPTNEMMEENFQQNDENNTSNGPEFLAIGDCDSDKPMACNSDLLQTSGGDIFCRPKEVVNPGHSQFQRRLTYLVESDATDGAHGLLPKTQTTSAATSVHAGSASKVGSRLALSTLETRNGTGISSVNEAKKNRSEIFKLRLAKLTKQLTSDDNDYIAKIGKISTAYCPITAVTNCSLSKEFLEKKAKELEPYVDALVEKLREVETTIKKRELAFPTCEELNELEQLHVQCKDLEEQSVTLEQKLNVLQTQTVYLTDAYDRLTSENAEAKAVLDKRKAAAEPRPNKLQIRLQEYTLLTWSAHKIHLTFCNNTIHLMFKLGHPVGGTKRTKSDFVENREILSTKQWSELQEGAEQISTLIHNLMSKAIDQKALRTTCRTTFQLKEALLELGLCACHFRLLQQDIAKISMRHAVKIDQQSVNVEFLCYARYLNFTMSFGISAKTYPGAIDVGAANVIVGKISEKEVRSCYAAVKFGPSYIVDVVQAIDNWLGTLK